MALNNDLSSNLEPLHRNCKTDRLRFSMKHKDYIYTLWWLFRIMWMVKFKFTWQVNWLLISCILKCLITISRNVPHRIMKLCDTVCVEWQPRLWASWGQRLFLIHHVLLLLYCCLNRSLIEDPFLYIYRKFYFFGDMLSNIYKVILIKNFTWHLPLQTVIFINSLHAHFYIKINISPLS